MSAHTKTSICNSMLRALGLPALVVDAESGAAQAYDDAQAVVDAYDARIGRVLRSHPWNFALRRVELEADEDAPAFGYAYQYTPPSDWVRVWSLDKDTYGDDPDYRVEGGKILTNYPAPLKVLGIERVEDPSLFDDDFAEALVSEGAAKAALSVLGSKEAARAFRAEAKEDGADARSSDAKENKAIELDGGSWLPGRSTG